MAEYECSFLYSHLAVTIMRYVKTNSLRQSSKMMQQCPAFNTVSKVKQNVFSEKLYHNLNLMSIF